MQTTNAPKPKLFIDADVIFAGAASPKKYSASLLILRFAEMTLIDAIVSEQVVTEVERNISAKIPEALYASRHLVSRCLTIVPDPEPEGLIPYKGLADAKDLPILTTAIREKCTWLVTFNIRHYQPGHPDVTILKPEEIILQIRQQLANLG